jgi:hypothetical protein
MIKSLYDLKLGDWTEIQMNREKMVKHTLSCLVGFFQDNMWDGSGEENDPKYVTKEEFDSMEALADKIEHMMLYIGCPNSVQPMLQSILTRKIKHWQGSDSVETKDRKTHSTYVDGKGQTRLKTHITKGHKKGKQLKTKDERRIVLESFEYGVTKKGAQGHILTGHFRWNNRGYMLTRKVTDMLQDFYDTNF